MDLARKLYRRLPLLLLLVLAALLRAEQGVEEVQGRSGQPSRLFRLVQGRDGDYWTYSVLGHEGRVSTRAVLVDTDGPLLADWLRHIRKALP